MGLVNRDNMMVIIRRALGRGHQSSLPPEIEYEDLNKNFVSAAARHLISEQQLAVLQVTHPGLSWLFADLPPAASQYPSGPLFTQALFLACEPLS